MRVIDFCMFILYSSTLIKSFVFLSLIIDFPGFSSSSASVHLQIVLFLLLIPIFDISNGFLQSDFNDRYV